MSQREKKIEALLIDLIVKYIRDIDKYMYDIDNYMRIKIESQIKTPKVPTPQVPCKGCGKLLSRSNISKHHCKTDNKKSCHLCSYTSPHRDLPRHLRDVHGAAKTTKSVIFQNSKINAAKTTRPEVDQLEMLSSNFLRDVNLTKADATERTRTLITRRTLADTTKGTEKVYTRRPECTTKGSTPKVFRNKDADLVINTIH